jgi:hypothetical protein
MWRGIHTHRSQRRSDVLLYLSLLYSLSRGLSQNRASRLAAKNLQLFSCPCPKLRVYGSVHTWLLHGCWRFELRSSCSQQAEPSSQHAMMCVCVCVCVCVCNFFACFQPNRLADWVSPGTFLSLAWILLPSLATPSSQFSSGSPEVRAGNSWVLWVSGAPRKLWFSELSVCSVSLTTCHSTQVGHFTLRV